MPIHSTAVVDSKAEVSASAEIGAYAIVEPGVTIGEGVRLYPHAYVSAGTTLERGVQVHPFAVVGHHPQDYAWKGAPSYTRVGEHTIIREHASVHRGSTPESTTVVGKRVFVMAMAHIGHNCEVADDVILTSGTLLAGYVHVGWKAMLAGGTLVHQFCRVGELATIAGQPVRQDVPPYMLVADSGLAGLNVLGMRRAGIGSDDRLELRGWYRRLFRSATPFREAVASLQAQADGEPARKLAAFLSQPSKRGILRYRPDGRTADGDA
jgi:UDP-N-acetylglucosamine acyltransferase